MDKAATESHIDLQILLNGLFGQTAPQIDSTLAVAFYI